MTRTNAVVLVLTDQNPASARGVAEAMVEILAEDRPAETR